MRTSAIVFGIGLCSAAFASAMPPDAASGAERGGRVQAWYRAAPGARDPFFLDLKPPQNQAATADLLILTAPGTVTLPGPTAGHDSDLDLDLIRSLIELQAVMASGTNGFAIINGAAVKIGGSLSVQVQGRMVELKLTSVSSSPIAATLTCGEKEITCTLSSRKRR